MLTVAAAYCSHCGDRDNNEDSAGVFEGGRVCLVADGMGGAAGGEVASQIATQTVEAAVAGGFLTSSMAAERLEEALRRIMGEANSRIVEASHDAGNLAGMGTTLTVAVICDRDLTYAHIGDSRLYHWREGRGEQLTQDHTRMQELLNKSLRSPDQTRAIPYANTLVKYLGTSRDIEPQIGRQEVHSGDRLLICSDGLYNPVKPAQLWEILGEGRPEEAAEQLVSAAKACGRDCKLDNVTALVVVLED